MIEFGTGGWREIIGDKFTKANIQKLSKALATKMNDEEVTKEGIVMGYDRRFLSKEAMHWAAEVFAAEGITTYLINRSSPTPLIMHYVKENKLHYGMMITASHNPAIYNGVKIFTYGGRDADETQTQEIENYINYIKDNDINIVPYNKAIEEGLIVDIYPLNDYLDSVIKSIDMEAIRGAGLKIGLDPMYGVSETAMTTILLTARCTVDTINDQHDTLFGGKLPSPNIHTLKRLQNYVVDKCLDLGIATDGDGDRIGVIDNTGKFIHPNEILVFLYYYLVKYKGWKGPVVRNIATTHMLDKVARALGEECHEVPVGFKYISAKMEETNAIIGGESSGGLTVKGQIKGKDGIYAAVLLVEMVAAIGKPLSEIAQDIADEFGSLYMAERDYGFTLEEKEQVYENLIVNKNLPDLPYDISKVSYLDGCKVYFKNDGWVIARFSGTEPLLRIFCEMPNVEDANKVCDIFEEFLFQQF